MGRDEMKFLDEKTNETVIFNYYTFCEILKGCLVNFCGISKEEANNKIENSEILRTPINGVNDVYFFSHEHPYHWAMVCNYGENYWEQNKDLTTPPEAYDDWESEFIKINNLKEEVFNF